MQIASKRKSSIKRPLSQELKMRSESTATQLQYRCIDYLSTAAQRNALYLKVTSLQCRNAVMSNRRIMFCTTTAIYRKAVAVDYDRSTLMFKTYCTKLIKSFYKTMKIDILESNNHGGRPQLTPIFDSEKKINYQYIRVSWSDILTLV